MIEVALDKLVDMWHFGFMKTATVHLKSASPYSQSRFFSKIDVPPLDNGKESPADYDARNWRHRQHFTEDGDLYIPPMALKGCLQQAAQYLGEKIPGKRNATWSKNFRAGVLVSDPAMLGIKQDKTESESFLCDHGGKKGGGGGSSVVRTFPVVRQWEVDAVFLILDETITKEVFTHHLEEAGKFIGIGRFRPINGGFYGRFSVESVKWE